MKLLCLISISFVFLCIISVVRMISYYFSKQYWIHETEYAIITPLRLSNVVAVCEKERERE